MKIVELLNDESLLKEVNDDNRVELLEQLKVVDFKTLNEKEVKGVVSFIKVLDTETQKTFIDYIISNFVDDEVEEPYKYILLEFKDILEILVNSND